MFDQNRSDACCEGWGRGSKMLVSAEVESEKKRNSLMERFPSIVLATSLEAWARAIISASWLEARCRVRRFRVYFDKLFSIPMVCLVFTLGVH